MHIFCLLKGTVYDIDYNLVLYLLYARLYNCNYHIVQTLSSSVCSLLNILLIRIYALHIILQSFYSHNYEYLIFLAYKIFNKQSIIIAKFRAFFNFDINFSAPYQSTIKHCSLFDLNSNVVTYFY
jgi:hypothetical protein